ncbi:hypothetical protein MSAN_01547800 [Mycena sanguinolenta]|uniref:Uncharacterized protein n=1 Tax=Mycena sanguinolenta TaxID=230812 RepID=A0A8H7CX51_9AGAR|nr:hypothetical protein MSAN_01547800 [Mycena sanguinolenta]
MHRSAKPSAARPVDHEAEAGETYPLKKALVPPLKIDSSSVAPTSPAISYPSRSASSSSPASVPKCPLLDVSLTETPGDEDLRKVVLKRRSLERALSLTLSFSPSMSRSDKSLIGVTPILSPRTDTRRCFCGVVRVVIHIVNPIPIPGNSCVVRAKPTAG